MHEAGKAVAIRAAHTGAVGHVRLVEHAPARRVERVVPDRGQVVRELLDPRLMRDRRERVRRARRRFGRVLATGAVHAVQVLGLRVVGLHLLVGDRPRRRDAVVVAQLAEVLARAGGTARRRRAWLRRRRSSAPAAETRGRARRTRSPRHVAAVDEHVLCEPVLGLARQPVAALEQQDALARRRQPMYERAPAGAAADDDHVVSVHAQISAMRSARMMRPAASISARCENACGKLPRWRPVLVSNSSA